YREFTPRRWVPRPRRVGVRLVFSCGMIVRPGILVVKAVSSVSRVLAPSCIERGDGSQEPAGLSRAHLCPPQRVRCGLLGGCSCRRRSSSRNFIRRTAYDAIVLGNAVMHLATAGTRM